MHTCCSIFSTALRFSSWSSCFSFSDSINFFSSCAWYSEASFRRASTAARTSSVTFIKIHHKRSVFFVLFCFKYGIPMWNQHFNDILKSEQVFSRSNLEHHWKRWKPHIAQKKKKICFFKTAIQHEVHVKRSFRWLHSNTEKPAYLLSTH